MIDAVLVDTSVWVSHFRFGDERLASLLEEGGVACHPFVMGELACGTIKNRIEIMNLLRELPTVEVASQEEILVFIDKNRLMGKGLGYVDVHLLGSAFLSDTLIWTLDKALKRAAIKLGISIGK